MYILYIIWIFYILYVYIPTLSLFAIEMVMFLSCWEGAPPEDRQVSKPTGLSWWCSWEPESWSWNQEETMWKIFRWEMGAQATPLCSQPLAAQVLCICFEEEQGRFASGGADGRWGTPAVLPSWLRDSAQIVEGIWGHAMWEAMARICSLAFALYHGNWESSWRGFPR